VPASQNCPPGVGCPEALTEPSKRLEARTGTWHTIAKSPIDDLGALATWTGKALLVYNSQVYTDGPGGITYPGQAAVWAPNTNSWTQLPNAPFNGAAGTVAAVWTGNQLLMWGEMTAKLVANKVHQTQSTVGLSYGN
jgi:hypothetical protein